MRMLQKTQTKKDDGDAQAPTLLYDVFISLYFCLTALPLTSEAVLIEMAAS